MKRLDDVAVISAAMAELGEIEVAVLRQVAERLRMGQREYGRLKNDDKRNWLKEAIEEQIDGAVYLTLEARRRSW